jgi:hypothetical protein
LDHLGGEEVIYLVGEVFSFHSTLLSSRSGSGAGSLPAFRHITLCISIHRCAPQIWSLEWGDGGIVVGGKFHGRSCASSLDLLSSPWRVEYHSNLML